MGRLYNGKLHKYKQRVWTVSHVKEKMGNRWEKKIREKKKTKAEREDSKRRKVFKLNVVKLHKARAVVGTKNEGEEQISNQQGTPQHLHPISCDGLILVFQTLPNAM